MKKKSQIVLFVILGLVLIVIVGIFLYISKSTAKKQVQQSASKVQETAIEQQPIKEFTALCLKKISKDAVKLIGKQGGFIYRSQGGTSIDFSDTGEGVFFIKYKKSKTAYNIKKNSLGLLGKYSSEIPKYPWTSFPYENKDSNTEKFEGIFGINHMPPLLPAQGQHSIQTQIESYIDNNLDDCLDFSQFHGYNIEKKESKTQVVIGSEDISIRSEIPLTILNKQTEENLELKDFSTTLKIRLEDLYFFTKDLIENDINDIKFNITAHQNNKNSFFIKVIEDAHQNDDLIVISDTKSLIDGQPYEYIFARENRNPALYFIKHTENLEFFRDFEIKEEDLLQEQQLKAEDPDEDFVSTSLRALLTDPTLPTILNLPEINFMAEANDGELTDHQIINVRKNG